MKCSYPWNIFQMDLIRTVLIKFWVVSSNCTRPLLNVLCLLGVCQHWGPDKYSQKMDQWSQSAPTHGRLHILIYFPRICEMSSVTARQFLCLSFLINTFSFFYFISCILLRECTFAQYYCHYVITECKYRNWNVLHWGIVLVTHTWPSR